MSKQQDFQITLLKEATNRRKAYTGIGSREAPATILSIMTQLAIRLAEQGWTLRSGGAAGADSAFESGCDQADGKKEIFLPWKGFNGNPSSHYLNLPQFDPNRIEDQPTKRAIELATQFHPLGTQLLAPVHRMRTILKLMARNSLQVLGPSLDETEKSAFLVCWTLDGQLKGGTRQAIVLAEHFSVPVFNLGRSEILERLNAFLD